MLLHLRKCVTQTFIATIPFRLLCLCRPTLWDEEKNNLKKDGHKKQAVCIFCQTNWSNSYFLNLLQYSYSYRTCIDDALAKVKKGGSSLTHPALISLWVNFRYFFHQVCLPRFLFITITSSDVTISDRWSLCPLYLKQAVWEFPSSTSRLYSSNQPVLSIGHRVLQWSVITSFSVLPPFINIVIHFRQNPQWKKL